jgi:hypothetical protein
MPYSLKSAKPLFIYTIELLIIAIRIHDGNRGLPHIIYNKLAVIKGLENTLTQ